MFGNPNGAEGLFPPDWFVSESRRDILLKLSVMKLRLPKRYTCPGGKAKTLLPDVDPITLVDEKLDVAPTWCANYRN